MQTTAVVHEVYLKLAKQKNIEWESRSHFFAIAAKLMRQILIDYARTKHRAKRGGAIDNAPLESALTVGVGETNLDLLGLDEALSRLAVEEEHLANEGVKWILMSRRFNSQQSSLRLSEAS